jgi:hypothetical protein
VTRLSTPSLLRFGRVNPLIPAAIAVVGLVVLLAGYRPMGGGVAIGAGLALLNAWILSKRVEFAAATGSVTQALMVMQIGLLVTFTIVGIATVILIHFSLPLTIGCAIGFVVAQLAVLAAFYWTHARSMPALDVTPSAERNAL